MFNPSEAATPATATYPHADKTALIALRDWHDRQVMHCATRYQELARKADAARFDYLKGQRLHLNAVAALNSLGL